MKRVANLYPICCDRNTILLAIRKASIGKRNSQYVKFVLDHIENYADDLEIMLKNKTFVPSPYRVAEIVEPMHKKHRIIYKPNFYPDQCVHWCLYLALKDWLFKRFYKLNCGSIPERGVHYGKKYVERWVRNDRKHTKYYLKLDVHHFYPSIKQKYLMPKVRRCIKDEDYLNTLEKIFSMSDGLPIGMLLSQVFANFFLTDFDYWVKQELKAKYYIRYMDDMVIFSSNKKKLLKMREKIAERLQNDGLTLKGNWQVFKFDNEPLDFMGFRFYRNRTIIRKSIIYRMTRKVRKVYKQGYATFKDASAIISYMGWIKATDSWQFYHSQIKPYVNINELKEIVRKEQNENL